jgi:hypothetical protein
MTDAFRASFDAARTLAAEAEGGRARWEDVAQAIVDLQGFAERKEGDLAEGPLLSYLRTAEEAAGRHDSSRVLHNLQRAERFLV